jgi:hypothetical protein
MSSFRQIFTSKKKTDGKRPSNILSQASWGTTKWDSKYWLDRPWDPNLVCPTMEGKISPHTRPLILRMPPLWGCTHDKAWGESYCEPKYAQVTRHRGSCSYT